MRRLLTIFIVLPSLSLAWEGVANDMAALGTTIRDVWSGGHWEVKDVEGFYRFVIAGGGYEHYKTKLYVQWIRHGSDMESPVVEETIEIKELNENPVYAFGLPKCIGGWQCSEVEINATHTYEQTSHKFKVTFTGVGQYEFKNAI